jgi:outer membrane protein assembly factor BamB
MITGRRIRRFSALVFFAFALIAPLAAQPVRFAVIADAHIGAGTAAEDLRAIVSRINGLPDLAFAVLDGDITEKGRDAEFAQAKRILGGLKIPWHVVPGNHDSHWIGQGLVGFREAWPSDRFFFEKAGRAFIGLNTWDFGHLAPDDLGWLSERIDGLSTKDDVFVFAHNPPAYVDNWFGAQEILRARRTVVVNGHVHRTQILDSAGLPVITVRRAMAAGMSPPGFALIESGPGGIAVFEVNGKDAPKPVGVIGPEKLGNASEIPPPVRTRDEVEIIGRAEVRTRVTHAPVRAGDLVVVADNAGRIHAFEPGGRERWVHDPEALCASRPWADDRFVFAATAEGKILKLDAASGRTLKAAEVGERVTSQLVGFLDDQGGERLLAGTLSGRMICLNADTLAVLWKSGEAKDMIQSRPLAVRGKVVFGSWDARVHALEAATGRPVWRWSENDNFYYAPAGASPLSDGRSAFVCGPDGFVSAIDLESGKTSWRERFGAWESLGVSSDRTRIFIKSRTDEFNVLAAATGRRLFQSAPAHGAGDIMPVEAVEAEGKIYFGALNGRVYEIGAGGGMKAVLDLGPGGIHSLLPLGEGRFAALDLDGSLVVFRPDKKGGHK